ncbi:ScbR family autoregulator-binding transcription factor [Kitasatospora sp. NPDC057198]|uniref:ScbR family autoregulator-binding transcription factor n=1 Tax=Kitasatospora sp. NPDC057198 TaxID=3346046 RepID=UPI0036295BE5
MATQDRAARTRRTILRAAAQVFEERGYQASTISEILATAGVTKGALYFHFQSKEELARGVLAEQDMRLTIPQRPCRTQELADMCLTHAHLLQTDPMVRAGVRLSLDQQATGINRATAFHHWQQACTHTLQQAQAQGELLPHINPAETATVLVGAFAGVQQMSQATTDYHDLTHQITALLKHLLPNIVHPSILTALDLTPHRGAHVYTELTTPPTTTTAATTTTVTATSENTDKPTTGTTGGTTGEPENNPPATTR